MANVGAAGGYSNNQSEQTTQVNALFAAGNHVNVTTQGDATLAGATVKGDSIDAHIGGNLTVESRQDTGSVRGESANASATVSLNGAGSSLSLGGSHTKGDSAWVEEQSGLFATGKNNVYVEKHTSLIGGVINSDSGDTHLDTGSLSYQDVHDYDHFKSASANVGLGIAQGNAGAPSGTANQQSQTPGVAMNNIQGGTQKREREQITRATVGAGTLTVRDDAATGTDSTQGLNRDIDRAQQITKDIDHSTNLYASDTSLKAVGAVKKSDNSSRLQQLKDTLNLGLAVSEITESSVAGIDKVDNALATGLTLGQAKPDANGNMGLLNDKQIAGIAGKAGDGVLAISDAVVNQDHGGNWHLFDVGTNATIQDHYTRNQDARLKQEAIRQVLAASRNGDMSAGDLVDLVNNLTDYDADQSQDVLSYIASQIANGDIKVGFYGEGAGFGDFGSAFANESAGTVGLNAGELNLRDPRDYMSALAEEGYHARDGSEDSYANLYGDRFGYLWDKTNQQEGRATGGSVTQADWMTQNRNTIAANDATYHDYHLNDLKFRQLDSPEIKAIRAYASQAAAALGESDPAEAERRMGQVLLNYVDRGWQDHFEESGAGPDLAALIEVSKALAAAGLGSAYQAPPSQSQSMSDVPRLDVDMPGQTGGYSSSDIFRGLLDYASTHPNEFNDGSINSLPLADRYSLERNFYDQIFALGLGDRLGGAVLEAAGQVAGLGDAAHQLVAGLGQVLAHPSMLSYGIQQSWLNFGHANEYLGEVNETYDYASAAAYLDRLQSNYFSAGRQSTQADFNFAMGMLGVIPGIPVDAPLVGMSAIGKAAKVAGAGETKYLSNELGNGSYLAEADFGALNQLVKAPEATLFPENLNAAPWSVVDDMDWGGSFGLGEPQAIAIGEGWGKTVSMDGHKIYDQKYPAASSNPDEPYRFSNPQYRTTTGGDMYAGENVATAYYEVRKNLDNKWLFVADMKIDNILDLTDPAILARTNIDLDKMTALATKYNRKTVYEYTQQIEKQAYENGYNGILYPSSRKSGANKAMVLFGGRYDPEQFDVLLNRPVK